MAASAITATARAARMAARERSGTIAMRVKRFGYKAR